MKKLLSVLAACLSLAAQAQPYRMEAWFSDGRTANLGSSGAVTRILTGYDTQFRPLLSLFEEGQTLPFALATAVDSLVIHEEEASPSLVAHLEAMGNYQYTLRLISDLGLRDTLSSPRRNFTLFAADDHAWQLFFASDNAWGVSAYSELTEAQKQRLLYAHLLGGSQWPRRLSGGEVGEEAGTFLRQPLADGAKIGAQARYVPAAALPSVMNSYWHHLIARGGAWLGYSESDSPVFTVVGEDFLSSCGATDEDRRLLLGADYPAPAGLYAGGIPVTAAAACLNGYVYTLAELDVPRGNMAEELEQLPDCKLFASFLDRFTMPVHLGRNEAGVDVWRKVYFAETGSYDGASGDLTQAGPSGLAVDSAGNTMPQLPFALDWHRNSCTIWGWKQDMPVLLVPTDQALQEWWQSTVGQVFMSGKESFDEVENSLLVILLRQHMQASLRQALPSRLGEITDDAGLPLGIGADDVERVVWTNNGVIYVVNRVFTPSAYTSVTGPLPNVENLTIMSRVLRCTDQTQYVPEGYGTLLRSPNAALTLLFPTNQGLTTYYDPIYPSSSSRTISFRYNTSSAWASATGTRYNVSATSMAAHEGADPFGEVSEAKGKSLLKNLLENSTIVMDPARASQQWGGAGGYFLTRGGATVYVDGFRQGAHAYAGGNVNPQTGEWEPATVEVFYNQSPYVLDGMVGSDGNGVFLQLDRPLQPTRQSVLDALAGHEEFSEFHALLSGAEAASVPFLQYYVNNPDTLRLYSPVYSPDYAKSPVVSFLGNFNYTLFAPTNEAMQQAYAAGLPRWSDVAAAGGEAEQRRLCLQIMDFVKLHFMDHSVATDGEAGYYTTQAFDSGRKVFREVYFDPAAGTVNPRDSYGAVQARLVDPATKAPAAANLSNIMACDYRLTAPATDDNATIGGTAHVLIHAIDTPLSVNE